MSCEEGASESDSGSVVDPESEDEPDEDFLEDEEEDEEEDEDDEDEEDVGESERFLFLSTTRHCKLTANVQKVVNVRT